MPGVHIIRHKPGGVFSSTVEVVLTEADGSIVRLVEPSGNVGTQYTMDVGSQWFGTVENLRAGLALGMARWSDVYKTDVIWTTPSGSREECQRRRDDFNTVYAPMIAGLTGGPLNSNRMARFNHREGFPDPKALFEVQVKAALGDGVRVGNGQIAYKNWTDHQPSGASVQHKKGDQTITTLGPDLAREMEFVLVEQYEKKFAEEGVDFKTRTAWMEILVAIDDAPEKAWDRVAIVRSVFEDYFGSHRPAGVIYLVSRIPNLDGIVEPQPRVIGGQAEIERSGKREGGFSTWTAVRRNGIREVMVSGVGGGSAAELLSAVDQRVREAGGQGLKANGVFNNAFIVAGPDSASNRAALKRFNESFAGWYAGTAPSGRTAQFVPGFVDRSCAFGVYNRSIFAG